MARTLDQVLAGLPAKRRAKIERRAGELATTLKDLREAFAHKKKKLEKKHQKGKHKITQTHTHNQNT